MSWKITTRFYQIATMVVLLIAAVALTTALVVAAEQNSDSSKKTVWHKSNVIAPSLEASGPKEWV